MHVTVLGAGSWGTTVAALTSARNETTLWARGPDLASVEFWSAGQDGKLGTRDDDTSIEFRSGTPAVETLLTDSFAPANGEMLQFATLPGSNGRMLIITLRANVQRPDGTYLLSSDLVLRERVALRW